MGEDRVVADFHRQFPLPSRIYSGRQGRSLLTWRTPPGGLGREKILGGEGRGVIAVAVDKNAALVLLQGAYFWFRDQDSSSQKRDMSLPAFTWWRELKI